ncbi:MAG: hypothetical protein FWD49_07640, partial [Firmicutes bacterium]|nr:hypothetical protein [Bacillota bacterium]
MEYIIFCIVIFALIATLAFRPRIEKRKGEIKELNSADFSEGIRNLSRNNRLIVRGGEIRLEPLMGAILRAEKVILKKVYKDEAITEGEKWFYENIYRMKRFVGGFNRREFCKNPSAGNAIRVLELARFIVENSQKSLNFKRISEAVNGANEESPLTYQEILSLKSALGVAIAERIYILAKRISHYEKMKNLAEKRGILNARLNSDIYIYYLINSGKNPAVSDRLIKRGISLKSAEFNHASSLHETAKIAKYLFESLKNLNDILPENSLGSLLVSDKELSQDLSYKCASEDTKHIMLRGIFKIAEASNTHESFVVKKLLNLADYNKTDPANIIIKYPRALLNYVRSARNLKKIKQKSGAFPQRIYAGAVLGISLFLSALSFFLFRIWFLPLLVFVPSFITAETVLNYLLARAVREKRLPRMNFSAIPNEHSAMIVVSEFISEASQMSEAIKRLRAIRKANHDKNITVALLADLRASHNETDIKDAGIINEAKEARADENICIFIRKRRKTGEKFVAHERKRGAVMALTSALISGNFEEFLYVLNPSEKSPNYLIALDQDNVLDLNGAKEMINVIAHPANESYDLIASRPRYNLFSLKTVYSKRFLTESAYVNYPNYSSLYHNLFSRDIFTGKGIFRLKSFHEKLHKTLPEKKVLSHDIIEGAILKTSSTCTVYEDAPKNFISDRERRKRWARGDIQLLPFTKNSWKNEDNKPHKSAVLPLYKFIIWRNVFNLFLPIFLLALGVSALFFPRIGFALLFFLFTPFILDSFGVITSAILRRERLRYALKDILVSFGNSVLEISMIPYYALSNFKLISATLFKMLIGGNLLEWKTYSQSQGEKGFARFVREVSVSMLIAPIVSILLFFFVSGFSYIYAVAFGAFSYLCYAVMFLLGCEKKPREISEKDSTTLKDYAQKTYQYFKFMRETKGLIADNLQIKPYKGISKTTSPTNIGFQLISEVSGYLLGLCSFKEVLGIIEDAVSVCEGLEKWHGNLYNWYSVKDNSIAVPFVSSVDSGNFLACLIAVSEFLKQEGETSLASRI